MEPRREQNPRSRSCRNVKMVGVPSTSSRRHGGHRALHIMVATSLLSLVNPSGGGMGMLRQAHAYVTSGLPPHTHRAFLRRLTDEICNTDPGTLTPQEVSSAPMLMDAWASSPDKLRSVSGKERALAVEGLLKRLVDERRAGNLDVVIRTEDYNAVMRGWAMSGEKSAAALRVEEILLSMQQMYLAGDEYVQPNVESFETAIEAWIRATDEPKALSRAQRILEWMAKMYLSDANDLAMPQTRCFHPVLKSWAASGRLEAPIVSENLIMWMQHLQMKQGVHSARPDTLCFNIVMSAWLKSNDVTAERRIRQIYEYMDKCRRRGSTDVKPDASTYNILITSIAPAVKKHYDMGGARRADKILARLEEGYLAGDESLEPDTIIYNQVIDYWAKTQSVRGHYLKARDVLDRQIAMHENGVAKCRPDVTGYTSVIAACASTYGSKLEMKRSFDLAHATFMECCRAEHVKPNEVTYGLMFKAVGRLLPKKSERNRYARTLFGLCCDDGCLGEMAFGRMKDAVSGDLLKELTDGRAEYEELPEEWRRNVNASPNNNNNSNNGSGSSRKQQSEGKRTRTSKKNDVRP